jgi:hypothetical protein
MTLGQTSLLKIDKDCFVDKEWLQGYVETIVQICRAYGVKVACIKMCSSQKKGLHFYVWIKPAVESAFANYLQWLLGDDCQRVDFNRARIDSDLNEWNKLFEVAGRRLRTVYKQSDCFSKKFQHHGRGVEGNKIARSTSPSIPDRTTLKEVIGKCHI